MLVLQVPAPLPPPDIPPEVVAWLERIPPELAVIIPLAVLLIGGSLLFVVVRAIARRIEGGGGQAVRQELEELRQRIAELESGQHRLAEIEERIEFNERMLVQQGQLRAPGADRG